MRNPEAPFHQTVGEAFKDSVKNGVRVVSAARDPVEIPTDPVIVEIAARNLCHMSLGNNCFVLTNVYGIEKEVPYGASIEEWEKIAASLLKGAMDEE